LINAIHLDCDIEIIGYWIYCFNSFLVKDRLKELDFWFSSKHKAWVFSGHQKSRYVTKATIDQLRAAKGNWKIERKRTKELRGSCLKKSRPELDGLYQRLLPPLGGLIAYITCSFVPVP
jgi:hypothetical protein